MSEVLQRRMAMLKMLPRPPKKVAALDLQERLAADGFDTSERNVQRDLQALAKFFPIECDNRHKPYGWRWRIDAPAFEIPAMDPKTALTLKLSATFLKRVLPHETYQRLEGHFRQAERVLASVPNSKLAAWPRKVHVTNTGLPITFPTVPAEILDVVTRALLEDRRFHCTYQKRDGVVRDYEVNPLALVYRDALGSLVCTLNKHDSVVNLLPHRIQSAELLPGTRTVPKGFDLDEYVRAGGASFLLEREPVKLVAHVHVKAIPTIAELPIAPDQHFEPLDDHRVRLTATVANTQELHRWLLGFGDALEVLAPDSVRTKLQAMFAQLSARYSGAPAPWPDPQAFADRGHLWEG